MGSKDYYTENITVKREHSVLHWQSTFQRPTVLLIQSSSVDVTATSVWWCGVGGELCLPPYIFCLSRCLSPWFPGEACQLHWHLPGHPRIDFPGAVWRS